MYYPLICKKTLLGAVCLSLLLGCGNRQGNVAAVAPKVQSALPAASAGPAVTPKTLMVVPTPMQTFKSNPPAISFCYPADWVPRHTRTAVFSVAAPVQQACGCPSLTLDIPKLPWHLPGMITLGMISHGYVDDLKKNLLPDAAIKDQTPLNIPSATAQRITCAGTQAGKPAFDIAVLMIHGDQVFILSADCDQAGYDTACKTLASAVASIQWAK
jgi:hypothetical protein